MQMTLQARRIGTALAAVMLLVLVAACGGERRTAELSAVPGMPLETQDYAQPDATAFPSNTRLHFATLRPGDLVEITIPEDPRFADGLQRNVDALGRLPVPLIGPIAVRFRRVTLNPT
ncbi:MAG: hypothetical protein ACOCXA_09525, partial [Planctomycetota bacterium]